MRDATSWPESNPTDGIVQLLIAANVVLWGYSLPLGIATLEPNALITIFSGFLMRGAKRRSCTVAFYSTIAVIVYGALVAPFSPFALRFPKFIFSLLFSVLCAVAVKRIAERIDLSAPILSHASAWKCYLLILAGLILEYAVHLTTGQTGVGEVRLSGIFKEPSHLALSVAPLLSYLWFTSQGRRKLMVVLCAGGIIVLSPSSTILLLFVSIAFMRLIVNVRIPSLSSILLGHIPVVAAANRAIKAAIAVALCGLAIALFLLSPLSSATSERLTGLLIFDNNADAMQTMNLSSAVYVNGWLDLTQYFKLTHGLGVGLNQMGVSGRPDTVITTLLRSMDEEQLNAMDGSFILSKLGSELGLVGVLAWLAFFPATWKAWRRTKIASGRKRDNLVFISCSLVIVSLGGAIRSTSYFSGPFLLGVLGLYLVNARDCAECQSCASKLVLGNRP